MEQVGALVGAMAIAAGLCWGGPKLAELSQSGCDMPTRSDCAAAAELKMK